MTMSRNPWIGACAATIIVFSLANDAGAQSEYTWDLTEVFAQKSTLGIADQMFADLVAEKTSGCIDVVPHFDGSLGYRGADHLDAVSQGSGPTARISLRLEERRVGKEGVSRCRLGW